MRVSSIYHVIHLDKLPLKFSEDELRDPVKAKLSLGAFASDQSVDADVVTASTSAMLVKRISTTNTSFKPKSYGDEMDIVYGENPTVINSKEELDALLWHGQHGYTFGDALDEIDALMKRGRTDVERYMRREKNYLASLPDCDASELKVGWIPFDMGSYVMIEEVRDEASRSKLESLYAAMPSYQAVYGGAKPSSDDKQ